jgi:hypothetical protein
MTTPASLRELADEIDSCRLRPVVPGHMRQAADEIESLREIDQVQASMLGPLRTERDEARGDAEREYGLRMLAEKERDALASRLKLAEAVCEAADAYRNWTAMPDTKLGHELIKRVKAWRERDGKED